MGFWDDVGKGIGKVASFTPLGMIPGVGGGGGLPGFWQDITGQTAADDASKAQREASQAALQANRETLAQQMQMFNQQQEMLSPFVGMAEDSMGQMGVLSGMQGADAQQAAVAGLENSPLFQSLVQQGEGALLQNAAATGGLRGGNTQGALAQFRPGMLQNEINQQFNRLGGIAGLGMGPLSQASAGFGQMAGAQGQAGAAQMGILGQMGQQNAANALAQYQLPRDFIFDMLGLGVQGGKAAAGFF